MEEILLHLAAVMTIVIYMYMPNYTAQEVADHSNDIYIAT